MTRRILAALSGAALLLSLAAGTAFAGNPSGSGQPNASCEISTASQPNGFSSIGFAKAELHYAGTRASPITMRVKAPHPEMPIATRPSRSTTWPAISSVCITEPD